MTPEASLPVIAMTHVDPCFQSPRTDGQRPKHTMTHAHSYTQTTAKRIDKQQPEHQTETIVQEELRASE